MLYFTQRYLLQRVVLVGEGVGGEVKPYQRPESPLHPLEGNGDT